MSTSTDHHPRPARFIRHLAICAMTATAFLLPSTAAHAQDSVATSNSTVAIEKPTRRIGEATTAILQAQADGSLAGAPLPMLGATATLSWQRYLDSYRHPIPETFTRKLDEVSPR